jgi:acyl-CoA thioester hydrolase
MAFVHRERVRFGDLDAMRHLNNVVYLRYFETARIAFIRELVPGHSPAAPEAEPWGLIFAECHINYRSPVYFDEEVEVACSVGEVRRSAFQVLFRMESGPSSAASPPTGGRRLVAEGYGWLVGFDYAAEKSAPLPESLRKTLESAG